MSYDVSFYTKNAIENLYIEDKVKYYKDTDLTFKKSVSEIYFINKNFYLDDKFKDRELADLAGLIYKFQSKEISNIPFDPKGEAAKAYHEVVRRMKNLKDVERLLSILPDPLSNTRELLLALEDPWDPRAPIFYNELFPLYALHALGMGHITQMQFGTLMIFQNAQKSYGHTETVPLYYKKLSILVDPSALFGIFFPGKKEEAWLTKEQQDEWLRKVTLLPKSEQQFLLVRNAPFDLGSVSAAVNRVGFKIFSHGGNIRIIPSVGMMQAFVDVVHGENAPQVNPVLGHSTVEDVRKSALANKRDLAVPFPGAPLPDKADGYLAKGHDFIFHDFFHIGMASAIPFQHRMLAVELADQFNKFRHRKGVGKYYFSLLDMEFHSYRPDSPRTKSLSLNARFWIDQIIQLTFLSSVNHITKENCQFVARKIVFHVAVQEMGSKRGVDASGFYDAEKEIAHSSISSEKQRFGVITALSAMQRFMAIGLACRQVFQSEFRPLELIASYAEE